MRLFKRCPHNDIRCVHGDEIQNSAKGFFRVKIARARCVDCASYLYDHDLPEICTETGSPHYSVRRSRWSWTSKE